MDFTTIIQVAIGIMFVWITLAMITSQIQEWLASLLSWRAQMLEDAIGHMLSNPDLSEQFYQHPLIQGLHTSKGARKPSGIPADKFALVLFEVVIQAGQNASEIKSAFENLKQGVENLKVKKGFEKIAGSLDTLMLGIENDGEALTNARQRAEGWFNDAMDRLGGSYRRRVQVVAIIAGIAISVILNADSIAIIDKLYTDPAIRAAIVQEAQAQVQTSGQQSTGQTSPSGNVTSAVTQLQQFSIPLGWTPANLPKDFSGWGTKLIGILVSGVAAAQGAPFWFDLLRKILSRNTSSAPAG
ncbi:MAG TPA: hypothetical protein VMT73_04535 [Anaerolineales bacterium]|nr:hypothetical protein [Anaerolineales bacterium]